MPAKSKAQFRLMKAIEQGDVKVEGLSKKKAKEYTKGQKYKTLPSTKKATNNKNKTKGKKK